MGKGIKTRNVAEKGIKAIDKAAVASERMKEAYIRTKDKGEHGLYAEEGSPGEYASDRVSSGVENTAREAVHQFDKQGRKGVKTTKENISKVKEKIQKRKAAAEQPKKQAEKQAARQTRQAANRLSEPVKTIRQERGAVKTLDRGKKSIKTVDRSHKTIKQASSTAKGTVKTASKSIKTAEKDSQSQYQDYPAGGQSRPADSAGHGKGRKSRRPCSPCCGQGGGCGGKGGGQGHHRGGESHYSCNQGADCGHRCGRLGCGAGDYCDLPHWYDYRLLLWDFFSPGRIPAPDRPCRPPYRRSIPNTRKTLTRLKRPTAMTCWRCPGAGRFGKRFWRFTR